MRETAGRVHLPRLILVPALISLAVTLLRLFGELQHWSTRWFNSSAGGVTPQGVSWVVGIVWLPLPFGVYFALRLARAGRAPRSAGRAVSFAVAGLLLLAGFFFLVMPRLDALDWRLTLLLIWTAGAAAGALQFLGWRELAQTLVAYGLAARAVVVLVMLLAMLGRWGTHYDYGREPSVAGFTLAEKFWWLAFFPQLVFWVGFTVVLGSLSGSIAYALTGRRRVTQAAPSAS
ncbi:MAG TPA: hypothetical protein VM864_14245 [Pyrinomonadaceae bacterium]|jgi:hypothetical protein|nr:hypothetical protein [Pyrinomonadaceae bacterium]